MHYPLVAGQGVGPAVRRLGTLVLVGMILLSAVAGSGLVAAQTNEPIGNTTTTGNATVDGSRDGNNSTAANPVNAVIQGFQQADLGYNDTSAEERARIRTNLRELYQRDLSPSEQDERINTIQDILLYDTLVFGFPMSRQPGDEKEIADIIARQLDAEGGFGTFGTPPNATVDFGGINIPSMMDSKLRSMANTFVNGAGNILGRIYDLAFSTPVPQNDGWHGVFGSPTNAPFQQLHQSLLLSTLYPVTNYLLGIGVLVLGLSLVVNPFLSRFRALDLLIKFVTFLLFYTFSWAAITLMHGTVNDITLWIRPSPDAMGELVTNVGAMGAAATGAYFAGSGGILATVFGLGLELGLRSAALQYFFPYVFPALLLLLYLSPWQRLRGYASMAIWQYVNLLTMIIPMAILLRAATIVEFNPGDGVTAMLILIALFLLAAAFPFASTYYFIQLSGSAAGTVKSATAGAASRVGAAKDKIRGGEASSSDSTATATMSPGDRAQAMVGSVRTSDTGQAQSQSQSRSVGQFGSSTAREHDAADSATTAGKIRALHEQENGDPMNPKAMKTAYFGQNPSHRT